MTTRTAHSTVTFTRPFVLVGIAGVQPPGTYGIDTDEETIDAVSFLAWRRVTTTIAIPRDGATSVWTIDPVDLEASLMRDAGLTLVPTSWPA